MAVPVLATVAIAVQVRPLSALRLTVKLVSLVELSLQLITTVADVVLGGAVRFVGAAGTVIETAPELASPACPTATTLY